MTNRTRLTLLAATLAVLTMAAPVPAQVTNYVRLHSFGRTNLVGSYPVGALVQGTDGSICGVTRAGGLPQPNGSIGFGTVFRVAPDGSGYGLLHQFGDTSDPSATPVAGLLLGQDGMLYGSSFAGTIFKLAMDGNHYQVLTDSSFNTAVGFGEYPLAFGRDGMLYGTSDSAVFKLDTNGTSLAVLAMPIDYFPAFNAVIQGSDGLLYGTTQYGLTNDSGTIYRMDTNGNNFTVLHEFTGTNGDGASPKTALLQAKSGVPFGSTVAGGSAGLGTLFKLNPDGTGYTVVHSFARSNDTAWPIVLLEGTDSMIYGTARSGNGAVFRMQPDGSGYTLLKLFSGGPADGQLSRGGLVEGSDGLLYGSTEMGGTSGLGTLFRMHKDGTDYLLLRHFLPWPADGLHPRTALLEGSDGALYGVTDDGYWDTTVNANVFRINKDGSGYDLLGDFPGSMSGGLWESATGLLRGMTSDFQVFKVAEDGGGFGWQLNLATLQPNSPLIETADGTLYGTSPSAFTAPDGAVFGLTSNNVAAFLHTFTGPPSDGKFPSGPLLKASDGLLYGVTSSGGQSNAGTVFRLAVEGASYTVVHNFSGDASGGSSPYGQLLEASDGALYGLAAFGGGTNQGLIYKLAKSGTNYRVLKTFIGDPAEGSYPTTQLVEGRDGALYGVNSYNSQGDVGTLFRINKDGSGFQVVRTFIDSPYLPAPPLSGSDGALYGVTPFGGDLGGGTIYRLGQMLSLALTPDSVSLGLAGIPGSTYDLQRSTNLMSWTTLSSFVMPADRPLSYHDTNLLPAAFYRLQSP